MTWSLPLRLDDGGSFAAGRADPLLDTARLILGVAPGERRLLPEFGWKGHLLRDLEDPVARQAAAVFAEEALRRWAGDLGIERVEVLEVKGRSVALELFRKSASSRIQVELRGWSTP